MRQGKFGAESDLARCLQSLRVERARCGPVANQYRGISQMARYARLERDDAGQVRNAVESRDQRTGRAAVANSDCGLEKVDEVGNGGFVVSAARCYLVQPGSDECTRFLQ